MITTRYYYDRLNKRDKQIYKAIYRGIMNYSQYVEVPNVTLSEQNVGWIYHCVLWDNPYIFSIGEYAMWHALSDDKTQIKITTLYDSNLEKICRAKIEEEVNKILSVSELQNMTDFQKEVFVHDFIINNVEYDKTCGDGGKKIQLYTVYGALVEHKAVCEGIAKAVKLLLNMLDVKCIVVSGKYDGNGHAWNIVKIDDWSYNLDVTMDMGRVIHKGKMRYNYFNFRTKDIPDYIYDNEHILPECVAIQNNYIIKAAGFVSSRERLEKYIERGLTKRKSCLYFKINKNVDDEFTDISFEQFQEEIDKAYCKIAGKLGLNTKRFIDTTGDGEIVSVEVEYI
jgi:hypothetical protein